VLLLQLPVVAAATPRAVAATDELTLASTSDTGEKGDVDSFDTSVSADGTIVAFWSFATNLDPADSDADSDVYAKNVITGDITLVSTSDTGVKGNGASEYPSVSADGASVAFYSSATNLDPGDTDSNVDVYVKHLATGEIILVSISDTGVKGDGDSYYPSLSADGSSVAFWSVATNLDPNDTDPIPDVYVKDLTTGDITLASTSDAGAKGNGNSFDPSLSADGTRVAFLSSATNLDPGDTDGLDDVYVKDLTTGDTVLASTSDTGAKSANGSSFAPSLADNGIHVTFTFGGTDLDPADTDFLSDVYVKNLISGDLTLVSTSDSDMKGDGPSMGSPSTSISADGARVTFLSEAGNLDECDQDLNTDVYVKDLNTGDITLASTSSFGVKSDGYSFGSALAADGQWVAFFSSGSNLDPGDTDSINDVYVKQLGPGACVPGVAISISDVIKKEGDRGRTRFVFTVTLSAPASGRVTVEYSTLDGSAEATSDYIAASGTLRFARGQTSRPITVDVRGDRNLEPDEDFAVSLFNASGAGFRDGFGTGTILNDDCGGVHRDRHTLPACLSMMSALAGLHD
jgi:hypothetical protein